MDETKIPSDEEYGKMLTEDKDDVEDEIFDRYLNAELMIDHGGETVRGTVVKRAKNDAVEVTTTTPNVSFVAF